MTCSTVGAMRDGELAEVELLAATRVGRAQCLSADIGTKLVLMSTDRGNYVGLDEVGAAIWERLEPPRTIAAICDELHAVFEADRTTLERDVREWVRQMRVQGLVDIVP